MESIKEIQKALEANFDNYASTRIKLLEELEKNFGNLFVHYGTGGKYEDWYYFVEDGMIQFGFSSLSVLHYTPPEQHIYMLPIRPCSIEDFEYAYDDARLFAKNPWSDTSHEWIKRKLKRLRKQDDEQSNDTVHPGGVDEGQEQENS